MRWKARKKSCIPVFGFSFGINTLYLSLFVLIPLFLVFIEILTAGMA